MTTSPTDSRKEAKFSRPFVIAHSKGHCDLCGDFHPYTLECHHIVPVNRGGHGDESNLVALCPNCHAVAEKSQTEIANDPRFHEWIRDEYGEDGYQKFERLFCFTWGNE